MKALPHIEPGALRAWKVFDGEPAEGCLLVIAASAGQAKTLARHAGLYEFPEYTAMKAHRQPSWDSASCTPGVIAANEDLPEGLPAFYDDDAA